VLINGYLEPSYPSSTTLLVATIMPTAIMQFNLRIKNKYAKHIIAFIIVLFMIFMIGGRLISGVHWLTDILGGLLLSTSLVLLLMAVNNLKA
jgi:undecaprenyl-diphosphatase